MNNNENLIKNRFFDLISESERKNIWTYSDFLNLDEQTILSEIRPHPQYSLYGGHDNAERVTACFGSIDSLGYEACPPCCCIKIEPLSQKFSDSLTHRDFLGSVMALGVKREMLGDIIISNKTAYLFCIDTVSDYIISQLDKVKHTSVCCCKVSEIPDTAEIQPEEIEIFVPSERLDCIIASAYNMSRSASQKLFEAKKIYVNSRLTENTSQIPKTDDIISVRGYGRIIYCGTIKTTKKNRLIVSIKKL